MTSARVISRKERLRRRDVYLRAAELIGSKERQVTCCAIAQAACGDYHKWASNKRASAYSKMFSIDGVELTCADIENAVSHDQERGLRITLLCMAAAMAETGDL